jgi:uncharacterized protein
MEALPLLCLFSLLAGFVDAVVGGGGLIQLPAFMILQPQVAIATALGTNKFASFFGTSFAVHRFARHVKIDWHTVAPAAVAAFLFAVLGARAVTLLSASLVRPLILALLVIVAIYVFVVKDLGLIHKPKHTPHKARLIGIVLGAVLGFYDGFFGPGMGSFLIFGFVGIFGFDFLSASASAKVVNWSTNLAAVIYFAWAGHILFGIGIAMAVSNVIGATLGARVAIAKGSRFVRIFFLVVVSLLIARLVYTMWQG